MVCGLVSSFILVTWPQSYCMFAESSNFLTVKSNSWHAVTDAECRRRNFLLMSWIELTRFINLHINFTDTTLSLTLILSQNKSLCWFHSDFRVHRSWLAEGNMTVWRGKPSDRPSPPSQHLLLKRGPAHFECCFLLFFLKQAACYWMRQLSHAHPKKTMWCTWQRNTQPLLSWEECSTTNQIAVFLSETWT